MRFQLKNSYDFLDSIIYLEQLHSKNINKISIIVFYMMYNHKLGVVSSKHHQRCLCRLFVRILDTLEVGQRTQPDNFLPSFTC